MLTTSKILLPLLVVLIAVGCRNTEDAPTTPALTYLSDEIVEAANEQSNLVFCQITFDFVDGDGNVGTFSPELEGCIGEADIEILTFQITDGERIEYENNRTEQCIEDLTPAGQNKLLEGEMKVRALFPPQTAESGDSLIYTAQIQDQDGNKSNIIESTIRVVD